ncbi:MAG TPA: hypothetical protein VFE47_25600 [Tepidisphaeraceae bacterium]|jgi:hypothetical protein|nr:hypothetical protein [Tepidisphaeraceae bacterium]
MFACRLGVLRIIPAAAIFAFVPCGAALAAGGAGTLPTPPMQGADWTAPKGVPMADRWFATLADDNAGEQKWAEALANIMLPVDATVSQRKPGEKPKFTGESLRAKRNPSLVDLVARRIDTIDHLDDSALKHTQHVATASEMAIRLLQWDPAAAKPVARKQFDFALFNEYGDAGLSRFVDLALALAQAGDHSGLNDYCDWIRAIRPREPGELPEGDISPLWRYPDDPAIVATAEYLFNDPKSPWNPIRPKLGRRIQQELLRSPLLGLKSFRDQMMRGLCDESEYCTITIQKNRTAELSNTAQQLPIPTGETLVAPEGTVAKIRNCDEYAYELSLCAGAPCIQFYWPLAQRDAAVKACKEFLTNFGDNLRYTDNYQFKGEFPEMRATARLTFAPLDHPATKEDVAAHRAIFSLEGIGERRLYKLPSIPAKGAWITLKKYPFDQQYFGVDGKSGVNHMFLQDCWVWQAEEVKTANGWERYFGVVGPHEIAKVPAADIDLTDQFGWASLPNGLDLKIEAPGTDGQGHTSKLSAKAPLLAKIVIRNRRGISQALPTQFVAKAADGKLSLRKGMKIVLTPSPDQGARGNAADASGPKSLPMKPVSSLSAEQMKQEKVLESTETLTVSEFDLRDLFDISRPGSYQLQLSFDKDSGFGEAGCWPATFEIVPGKGK